MIIAEAVKKRDERCGHESFHSGVCKVSEAAGL